MKNLMKILKLEYNEYKSPDGGLFGAKIFVFRF